MIDKIILKRAGNALNNSTINVTFNFKGSGTGFCYCIEPFYCQSFRNYQRGIFCIKINIKIKSPCYTSTF
jgi:hypothetical protein